MTQFELFSQLHITESPLLVGNCWDAGSAKLLEQNGFKAIATSSAAVAVSAGYEDGEKMPFELLLENTKRIKKNISVPLSVDIERGYSNDIAIIIEHIEKLYDAGVAGINIEDSTADKKLQPAETFEKTISSITNRLAQKNMPLFINARTDAFLLNLPGAAAETKTRIKLYEAAGACGIFVPFISDENVIRDMVQTTGLPVNILSVPNLPHLDKLALLGVKRVSLGSSLFRFANRQISNKLQAIQQHRSLEFLF